jgi:hypothetical protein
MSKTLWNTIKLEVPRELVNITQKNKVVVKKALTKTNSIAKSNKEQSIKIIPGDVNKPKIINDGKEWNIEELKIRMKKAKDLTKKNEGKVLKKKSDNKINTNKEETLQHIKKERNKKLIKEEPIKLMVKKVKSVTKENKDESNDKSNDKLTDEQIVVNGWDTENNNIIFYQYDEKAYKNVENTIINENKLNHHIFTPDLLAFTKKYNDKIIKQYSTNKNYKEGMDILYKGLYNIIDNIIDSNNLKMKTGSPVDVFKDRRDYNLGLKRISKTLAYKIFENKD